MKSVDATSAKNRFGELLEACRTGPIAVKRHGRVVAYVVDPQAYATGHPPDERLAAALRGAGARYATVFGSVANGTAAAASDIDLGASVGRAMSRAQRIALIEAAAAASGRAVDLVDLERANGLVLARALKGRELFCDDVRTRQRLVARLLRQADDRRLAERAAGRARASLFR